MAPLEIDWFLHDVEWLHFATIPLFTGIVGWLINWTGLIMLFNPIRFHGVRVPGMRELATVLPRKLQEVPGLVQGGIGWQGIIPARAAKMGSIAVDKAIAKLGTPAEFYQQLEPEDIAEHIVEVFRPDVPDLVDEVMTRERPRLWRDLPALRIGAILLFSVTVLKVLTVDLAGLDALYRILSVLVLGAALLIASFLYARSRRRAGETG